MLTDRFSNSGQGNGNGTLQDKHSLKLRIMRGDAYQVVWCGCWTVGGTYLWVAWSETIW